MAQLLGAMGALAGLSLGLAWWNAEVDVRGDPPAVVRAGDWVTGCARVAGGLELMVHEALDLLFSFEGLDGEVALGYAVRGGATRFRAGADDTADVTIGGATSSIGGEHALRWGNWATAPGGVVPVSAAFSSVGRPYEFALEGISDLGFWEIVGRIPYATLTATPSAVVVPWAEGGRSRARWIMGRRTVAWPMRGLRARVRSCR